MPVPTERVRALNDAPIRATGAFVLYWMVASRRTAWSFALDRALEHARDLGRPLLVLEALRVDHPRASDRLHRFVLEGMADNAQAFAESRVGYLPWVEQAPGEGRGLVETLARRACVVVTDDWPAYFLPRMVAAAGARAAVRFEAVDGVGLLPFRGVGRPFARAVDFRRHLQRHLAPHLLALPSPSPLSDLALPPFPGLPADVARRWRPADEARLSGRVLDLPIDHGVGPVDTRGGARAAGQRWQAFLSHRLSSYPEDRRHPDEDGQSGLSPWLHFGHFSVHRAWSDLAAEQGWSADRLGSEARGAREGWWGLSPAAEAFLDELVTWRELALNGAAFLPGHDSYAGTPAWARRTLDAHRDDPRPHRYTRAELLEARTHDPVWNAAQRQLREVGTLHNQLRMLWGKRVLEWSLHPEEAYETLVELNDSLALDGRDPNSHAGIGWVFGRYDRPWGPERPIFGTVRYMSSDNTLRKLRMRRYMDEWRPPAAVGPAPGRG